VARFLFDLRAAGTSAPAVDGIAFRSRMGDDIRMWALFERTDAPVSEHISPDRGSRPITDTNEDLQRALELLGLHWKS
jgi:hypothetical protein|tara:strand:+ start:99 stop:332 length:234 start_codon:yes stop_codon:yes gene_type:complete